MTSAEGFAELTLRDNALALCLVLRREVAKYGADRAGQFARLQQAYSMNYQPEAWALAKALMPHVPISDQKATPKFKISKEEISIMERPLKPAEVSRHLLQIARTLEHLTALVFFY